MRRLHDTRVIDGLLALALAIALVVHVALRSDDLLAVDVAGALALTLPLAARRRAPLRVTCAFAGVAVLNAILGGGLFEGEPPPPPSLLAGALAFYSLGAYAEERDARTGAAIGVAGFWTAVLVSGQVDVASFLFSAGLIVATPWLIGRSHRARAQRVALLEREQRQRERAAVGEERARIARELHDVVAHSVGVMVVQAQGAQRMLDRDPERAREALVAIEATGRTALSEMRRSLGVLRRPDGEAPAPLEPQPGLDGLAALVEQARQSGLAVELVTEGEPAPLPSGIDLSAYRIVQEALTNTLKHAGPVPARVAVRYNGERLELEITDDGGDGDGARPAADGAGQGLVGMRERVALYGGELHAAPRPEGGFVVRASLPIAP
ncbi:MAG TPA: sensor histidine kinase [Solirubrobacteraceae bacterium]|nr:sensor histidine kinase [Solirubrobacteraceae bacterium]